VSSVPKKEEISASSSLWIASVPQMNRTDASPPPHRSIAFFWASRTRGWFAKPR